MHDVSEFFKKLFRSDSWPARWHCGNWTPFHGWLYIISNILIALAYFSIPLILFYIIKKTKNKLPFQRIFWLFFIFILACGFTHVFDALMFWYPIYRVSAVALFITALVSCAAVIGLFKVIPGALTLKSPEFLEKIILERTTELERSNEYLKQTNIELEHSRKASEQLMKQKDDFMSIASHELKTPVTSLKAYTQILCMDPEGKVGDKLNMLTKMDAQINKLTVLINDLLDTTKLQEGILVYKKENIRLNEMLKEMIEETQRTTSSHKIIIDKIEPVTIYADKERMQQVISNLLSNAIKYSPDNDNVIVNLSVKNDEAICSVQDFGVGIQKDQQEKIFDRFYRATGNNLHTFPGLGLGLYISKNIILKHNGNIWVEGVENKGSTFYFSLPVAQLL